MAFLYRLRGKMSKLNKNFYDFDLTDWQQWCTRQDLPKFRAKQIFKWQNVGVKSAEELTDLSKELRKTLAAEFNFEPIKTLSVIRSQLDPVAKFLFLLADRQIIEAVLMHYDYGTTLCLTTQVGCRMGCDFCASAPLGLIRNLTSGELLAQVTTIQRSEKIRISNIVLMGIGEPLDNYQNTVKFLRQVNHPDGLNISLRKISLSTCGVVPMIYRFAEEKMPVTLSLSLHASNQQIREQLMPVAKQYDIDKVLRAVDDYFEVTGRRVTYEYALFHGINDSEEQARQLSSLLKNHRGHINLIPANPVPGKTFSRSPQQVADRFKQILERDGYAVTIRKSMGKDIEAACGQLRRQAMEEQCSI